MFQRKTSTTTAPRLLSAKEAAAYLGLGKNTARSFAEECGAVRRYGKRVLFDRLALDRAIDELSCSPGQEV